MASRIVQAPAAYAFPPGSGCRLLDQPVRFVSPGIYARDWECRDGNGRGGLSGLGDTQETLLKLAPEHLVALKITPARLAEYGFPYGAFEQIAKHGITVEQMRLLGITPAQVARLGIAKGDLITLQKVARAGAVEASTSNGATTGGMHIGTVLLVVGGLAVVGVGAGLLFRRARR